MITKMELRPGTEDKETREGSIAGVNESGEEVGGLLVDGERMYLKYELNYTIENGEDDVEDCDAGCGDPFPLQNI